MPETRDVGSVDAELRNLIQRRRAALAVGDGKTALLLTEQITQVLDERLELSGKATATAAR